MPVLDPMHLQGILDQRLQESAENWRLVYKSLLLLEYMVKHGPMVRRTTAAHNAAAPFGTPSLSATSFAAAAHGYNSTS